MYGPVGDALQMGDVTAVLDGRLPMNARQEQFSLAFVRMVVAAAGCSIKCHETDYDGVDITIVSSARCPRREVIPLPLASATKIVNARYVRSASLWVSQIGATYRECHAKRLDGFGLGECSDLGRYSGYKHIRSDCGHLLPPQRAGQREVAGKPRCRLDRCYHRRQPTPPRTSD